MVPIYRDHAVPREDPPGGIPPGAMDFIPEAQPCKKRGFII